uniref:Uncharacterized protein n=1 Tax=Anopheles merus TaxID=30066 RepID=A0A182UMT8_ANOME
MLCGSTPRLVTLWLCHHPALVQVARRVRARARSVPLSRAVQHAATEIQSGTAASGRATPADGPETSGSTELGDESSRNGTVGNVSPVFAAITETESSPTGNKGSGGAME